MRKGKKKSAAELVMRLVEIGTADLMAKHASLGLTEDVARTSMREIAHKLCQDYGGSLVYVPKDDDFLCAARDADIWAAFDGTNHQDLADRHGLTLIRIYQIIAAQRAKQRALSQHQLPGFEEV
jgi:Mor family transcriptional regulator